MSLQHWAITHTTKNNKGEVIITAFSVYDVKPRFLRCYWMHQSEAYVLPTPRIPRAPPSAFFITKAQWKRFWQLPMPHKARNCWWRFLIQKLPTRLATRHAQCRSLADSRCTLCNEPSEDDAHFLFHCQRKRSFWLVARRLCHIDANLPQIWDFLTFRVPAEKTILIRLSHILLVLWQMHWHCTFDDIPWNTTHALQRLQRLRWLSGTASPEDSLDQV